MTRRHDEEITDRRQWRRFQIQLPCVLDAGTLVDIPALAGNISRAGLLVYCESPVWRGKIDSLKALRLEVSSLGSPSHRTLDCRGKVVWHKEQPSGEVLLGFSISTMRFRSVPPGALAPRPENGGGLVM